MPPRQGQLDEISQAIGRLEGKVDEIDRYQHTREHGINNLTQKLEALSVQFSRDVAAAKAEINVSVSTAIEKVEARLQAIDERVVTLERLRERDTGAKGMMKAILASPVIAWLFAAAVAVWTYLQTHGAVK